jgi:hypothetical protein
LPPDRESIQAFGVGNREKVARDSTHPVGRGLVRLVALAVAAKVDVPETVIAAEFVDVPRLGPPRPIAAPAVQQHERPTLADHVVADLDATIREFRHAGLSGEHYV